MLVRLPDRAYAGRTLGLDLIRPRLSWWLPPGASKQLAYRLRTKQWDSGRVQSDNNLLVELGGLRYAPVSMECAVKVWTELGESDWSDPINGRWACSILTTGRRGGSNRRRDGDLPPGKRPTWYLRHEFVVGKPPRRRDSMQRTRSLRNLSKQGAGRRPRARLWPPSYENILRPDLRH